MDEQLEQLVKRAGRDAAVGAAIITLMAQAAQQDPDYPEKASKWMDGALGRFPEDDNSQDDVRKPTLVHARELFQQMLSGAVEVAKLTKGFADIRVTCSPISGPRIAGKFQL